MREGPPAPRAYEPPSTPAPILFRDAALLVADKPAGLLAVPGRGDARQDCLQRRLEIEFGPLETVHRLDMDTSGLIVFARSKQMGRALSVAFSERAVSKHYAALVHGVPEALEGEITLPIGRDWTMRPLRRIDPKDGQTACTRWRLVRTLGERSLLDLEPVTGRTHQLRLHLAATGHPICGDRLYGAPGDSHARLCLHAARLAFDHPGTGERISLESPHAFGV
ncbi:MAG: RluA family pseudouridine synthase [Henriciella sp.]|uniref:RluA family pseudouridine synthase n=1 Tax=Henriciella sp. TaxID=1968823 RepID=UPI0032EFC14C